MSKIELFIHWFCDIYNYRRKDCATKLSRVRTNIRVHVFDQMFPEFCLRPLVDVDW